MRFANRFVKRWRFTPALVVRGRKSGKAQEVPVNVLEKDDSRYIVSPRGETEWVRNLRAAGGRAELRPRKGEVEAIAATEVPEDAKPDLIAAYRERWDGQTKAYWKALPDPADHPVFEIRPTEVPAADKPDDDGD